MIWLSRCRIGPLMVENNYCLQPCRHVQRMQTNWVGGDGERRALKQGRVYIITIITATPPEDQDNSNKWPSQSPHHTIPTKRTASPKNKQPFACLDRWWPLLPVATELRRRPVAPGRSPRRWQSIGKVRGGHDERFGKKVKKLLLELGKLEPAGLDVCQHQRANRTAFH